jgi:uncharacterized membrane protein YphA (DoxX/SURF4 family)
LSAKAIGLSSIVLGFILLIGLFTPIAGLFATLGYLMNGAAFFLATDLNKHPGAFTALDLAGISLALVLLGPGAYSVDALLFGRREIMISEPRRPPH